jgi:hypothetical protein
MPQSLIVGWFQWAIAASQTEKLLRSAGYAVHNEVDLGSTLSAYSPFKNPSPRAVRMRRNSGWAQI